jgi:hypothetical protein
MIGGLEALLFQGHIQGIVRVEFKLKSLWDHVPGFAKHLISI